MQGFRGDAILCAGHVPRRGEPNHERSTCAVEDGSGRHRDAALALFAPESPATHPPTAGRVASRTDETVGPAKPFKIVEAGRFVREPRQQIGIAGRIISPCSKIGGRRLRRKRHPYILCLQHSDGYPFTGMPAHLDRLRGLDHGAWTAIRLMGRGAEIPVVQLSLVRSGMRATTIVSGKRYGDPLRKVCWCSVPVA